MGWGAAVSLSQLGILRRLFRRKESWPKGPCNAHDEDGGLFLLRLESRGKAPPFGLSAVGQTVPPSFCKDQAAWEAELFNQGDARSE